MQAICSPNLFPEWRWGVDGNVTLGDVRRRTALKKAPSPKTERTEKPSYRGFVFTFYDDEQLFVWPNCGQCSRRVPDDSVEVWTKPDRGGIADFVIDVVGGECSRCGLVQLHWEFI
ncbi:MAG: hypothetical protein ACOC9T_00145 [Myxococcota bacterium]